MIFFTTPTEMPIEAATTMGVSVKSDSSAIGKFGTGMKYAVAGVLRLGGSIAVRVGDTDYQFAAVATDIRGRSFGVVHCNGVPCGFTTDLGKHWQPWQIFRELASNALDEGGAWSSEDTLDGETVIRVDCREVETAERDESVFLGDGRFPLVQSTGGATIYEGASRHYYFRGIRAGSFSDIAPVTIDVEHGELSEDRLLDLSTVEQETAWAFRTATSFDEGLMLSVLSQSEPEHFWVRHVTGYCIDSDAMPKKLMEFMAARRKWVKHPAFHRALMKYLKGSGDWKAIEPTDRMLALLSEGEAVANAVGVDCIPRDKVYFTADLGDQQLAVTKMDTRDVWFSTQIIMRGRDEFLCGYLEEAIHAMTGAKDYTRELQNILLSLIVANCAA